MKKLHNTPFKKTILALTVCALLPATALAQKSEKKRNQNRGYLGQVSETVIETGQLARLEANMAEEQADFLAVLTAADLKERVAFWHNAAMDTVALDHTSVEAGGAPTNNGGPTRTSRALAMIQISAFEAINAVQGGYESYIDLNFNNADDASPDAAVSQAVGTTMLALYPDHAERLELILDADLNAIEAEVTADEYETGIALGTAIAEAILESREGDNSEIDEPAFGEGGRVADGTDSWFGSTINGGTSDVGEWTPDPNTPEFSGEADLALGAYWGSVTPFFLNSGDQFRSVAPPLPGDDEYREAYIEAAEIGGALDNTGIESTSTEETRFIANYWGYDGVPLIGVPPRVYNQIAEQLSNGELTDALEYSRFLALINIGMADVAIAAWDSKYYYNYWRPVTGIRARDGDRQTPRDQNWDPIGVSVVNTEEPIRATPPFPAYPSGHAAFGGVVFEIMRSYFGDDTPFTFISDEFNGDGYDPFFPDTPRALVPVRFETLTEAQEENGVSRIYNGVHGGRHSPRTSAPT